MGRGYKIKRINWYFKLNHQLDKKIRSLIKSTLLIYKENLLFKLWKYPKSDLYF